jgi:hypothetical protein
MTRIRIFRLACAAVFFATFLGFVFNAFRLFQQIDGGASGIDFVWKSLHLLLERRNPYEVYLHEIQCGLSVEGPPNYLIGGLLPMMPLGAFPEPVARWIWLALNVGFGSGMVWLLQKRYPLSAPTFCFAAMAFLAATPLRIVLLNCQTSLYVIFLMLFAQRFASTRPWLAGMFLAISLMKYSLTLPLAMWFGLKRERLPAAVWGIGWMFAFITIGAWWMKCGILDALLGPLRLTAAGAVAIHYGAADLFSICHQAGIRSLAIPGITALVLLAIFQFLLMARRENVVDGEILAFLAALSCSIFFHLPYDYVILVIPLWAGLKGVSESSEFSLKHGAIVAAALIPWLPKEVWSKLSEHMTLIKFLGDLWWSMGPADLANFIALFTVVVLLLPRVASIPSFGALKRALWKGETSQ